MEELEGACRSCPIVIADSPVVIADSPASRSPVKVAVHAREYRDLLDSDVEDDIGTDFASDIIEISEPEIASTEVCDGQPVYETPPEKYSAERIIHILLDPNIDQSKVCTQRPLNIVSSCTFVVDLDHLLEADDVKKDNFGVWNHSGSHDLKFQCRFAPNGVIEIGKGVFTSSGGWESYSLRRLHSNHPTNSKFRRMLAFITDADRNPHHLCLVTYHMPPGYKPLTSQPHGNSRSNKPYFATWPSTLKMIKQEVKDAGPKDVVASVSAKVGGVIGARAPGQLPRGEMQVTNAKRALKFSEGHGDELFVMMQQAKSGDRFVRDIKAAPEPALVVASDRQLDDLARFCGTPSGAECSILTVDPTFSLGDFECTPITYRHLLLVSHRYSTSPIFIGPILIHYRKNFGSFLFFASSLLSLKRELQCIRAIGTDGEKALIDAFKHEFRFATHLQCFIHARNSVKRQLAERKYPESVASEIADEVFGKQVGSTYVAGLVDSASEEEFFGKLEAKKADWLKREADNAGVVRGFFDWFFQYKVEMITSSMLQPVREDAGLGCPPASFTTNACESLNAMLKRKVNYKKNELPAFVDHLKSLIDEQERELERAVIGRGKYRFRREFQHFQVEEEVWFRMSRDQREKHLKKVAQAQISCLESESVDLYKSKELSIDPQKFHSGLSIPLPSVQAIWSKAAELISEPNSIVAAPGHGTESKMVLSRRGKRPHLVTCGKNGRYSCDSDCPNWKSLGICSHSVAVAQMNGSLQEFCDYYRKSKRLPSMSQLLLSGMPSGMGNKGNRVSRKRKKEEITSIVPLPLPSSTKKTHRLADQSQMHPILSHEQTIETIPHIQESSIGTSSLTLDSIRSRASQNAHNVSTSETSTSAIPTEEASTVSETTSVSNLLPHYTTFQVPQPLARYPIYPTEQFQPPFFGGPGIQSPFPQAGISFHTTTGNIRVRASPMHVSTPYQFTSPSTSSESNAAEFRLCFRIGNISVCNGCRNRFDKTAQPPYDLCIQHEEWRNFTSPVSHLPDSRFGNAYYHASPACIMARWPLFVPSSLVIPSSILTKLQPSHKSYIHSTFGILL